MNSTAIQFTMHPDLLRSVIKKQAGTLAKAALEGVMNSIDAGASNVEVTLKDDKIIINDDGRGFVGREEIDLFFKTFGQPHQEGDAIYGQFRMGRGQMFAFGVNTWRTGTYQMVVDIDKSLGFTLDEGLSYHKGCNIVIKLYRPLAQWEFNSIVQEIQLYVKYTNVPVFINGEQVNYPPKLKDYPDSIDEAFIKLDASNGGLKIFNLGVFVQSFPASTFGVSGVVISRKQLNVNFARNMVLVNECKVWGKVQPILNKRGKELIFKKPTLTDSERENAIQRLVAGEILWDNVRSLKVFVDITGKPWSIAMIKLGKFEFWSYAEKGNGQADQMIQHGRALVFDKEWLSLFGCKPEQVFEKYAGYYDVPTFKEFDSLKEDDTNDYSLIPLRDWTVREKLWIEYLNGAQYEFYRRMGYPYTKRRRDMRLGISTSANAWTDGKTEIVFNKQFLKEHPMMTSSGVADIANISRVLITLIHEFTHDTDSRENIHTPEFYQAFHDTMRRVFGPVLEKVLSGCTKEKYDKNIQRLKKGKNIVDDTLYEINLP